MDKYTLTTAILAVQREKGLRQTNIYMGEDDTQRVLEIYAVLNTIPRETPSSSEHIEPQMEDSMREAVARRPFRD